MSRNSGSIYRGVCFGFTIVTILLLASANAIAEPGGEATTQEPRRSVSLHLKEGGPADGRDLSQGSQSVDEYQPLVATGLRTPTVTQRVSRSLTPKGSTTQSATLVSTDFWFYEADVVLLYDDDEDGYFYGVDLLFDADTFYDVADVYAVVYLSYEGGPWNEYAATEDFSIFGSSPNDEYVLVTELRSGYPTGEYDLLIELFDAFDGSFLASFGPQDTSELSFLPLEDFNRDAPGFDTPVTVSQGGGGAAGLWLLILLAALLRRSRLGG